MIGYPDKDLFPAQERIISLRFGSDSQTVYSSPYEDDNDNDTNMWRYRGKVGNVGKSVNKRVSVSTV